jgi:trypsin-like peptidase
MQTTRKCSALRASTLVAVAGCLLAAAHAEDAHAYGSRAASIAADTRQTIMDCTFEVLSSMNAGVQPDRLQPFSSGTQGDIVRAAGTASCFGNGQLVSAAHVFDQMLGGRFEAPVVRDRRGRVYPVDKIIRYSMRNDFVVFTAAGLSADGARPHGSSVDADGALYLAWRRGDGDITFSKTEYRGQTTVETIGRKGWIEFGPAPGHGASGAALYNASGQIVGIINSRGSEAADAPGFAVPVEQVDYASDEWADIAMRDPLRLLGMPSQRNQPLIGGIPLPSPYAKFEKHMIEVRRTYFAHMLPYSLSLAGEDAPMSDSLRIELCAELGPGYCDEASSDVTVTSARGEKNSRGCSTAWSGIGAALIRCAPARSHLAAANYGRKSTAAAPPAPCTNYDVLGEPVSSEDFADHTGVQWQVRAWPVNGCDWVVLSLSRATADGTLTLIRGAPSAYAEPATMQLKALTAVQCDGCNGDLAGDTAVLAEIRQKPAEVQR